MKLANDVLTSKFKINARILSKKQRQRQQLKQKSEPIKSNYLPEIWPIWSPCWFDCAFVLRCVLFDLFVYLLRLVFRCSHFRLRYRRTIRRPFTAFCCPPFRCQMFIDDFSRAATLDSCLYIWYSTECVHQAKKKKIKMRNSPPRRERWTHHTPLLYWFSC